MLIIQGDRGSGKTTALVAAFLADGVNKEKVLVMINQRMVEAVKIRWPALSNEKVISGKDLFLEDAGTKARLYVDERKHCILGKCLPLVVAYTETIGSSGK